MPTVLTRLEKLPLSENQPQTLESILKNTTKQDILKLRADLNPGLVKENLDKSLFKNELLRLLSRIDKSMFFEKLSTADLNQRNETTQNSLSSKNSVKFYNSFKLLENAKRQDLISDMEFSAYFKKLETQYKVANYK